MSSGTCGLAEDLGRLGLDQNLRASQSTPSAHTQDSGQGLLPGGPHSCPPYGPRVSGSEVVWRVALALLSGANMAFDSI